MAKINTQCSMMLILRILVLLGVSEAFLSSSAIRQGTHRQLFVDDGNGKSGGPVTKKDSQWDIPDSKSLEPFSSRPKERLENGGRITLVGSGPGDPDLLTMSAYKLLQEPNALVICDRLVSNEIVDLIQGEVKTARKMPGCAEMAQEEIYQWAHEGLSQGKHVIRLKIGDPFVFGRGGEEVITFRRYGVEPRIVPVSSIDLLFRCSRDAR
jgi:hypothetical protein